MADMALSISLRRGFQDDDVEVRVDGRPIWHGKQVTTQPSASVAAFLEDPDASGRVDVEIRIGSRGVVGRKTVDATKTPFLAVSMATGGLLSFQATAELLRAV
jgi:hypothetical protein